jgi:hypothetical protein
MNHRQHRACLAIFGRRRESDRNKVDGRGFDPLIRAAGDTGEEPDATTAASADLVRGTMGRPV